MSYRQPFRGDYPITQHFGEVITDTRGHTGIDYGCPAGTPVLASNDGLVFYAGWKEGGYGYCVFIRHDDGNVTIYEHLLKDIVVTIGQHVKQGQVIGFSGSTGNSTGPHLHFEIRDYNGKAFDPAIALQSVVDNPAPQPETNYHPLKDADKLPENVRVVAPLGARRYNLDWTYPYPDAYQVGTELHFTGNTATRPGYPYTYCEVYEEPRKYWVAVHDGETQILDGNE